MAFKSKISLIISISVIFYFTAASFALAHNPRIVSEESVKVQNPEISQAFYGELKGNPQIFEIDSDKNFTLYINILVPKLPDINKDINVLIYKESGSGNLPISLLDGANFNWTDFYEPFGGDNYYMGPEFEKDVESGKYLILVIASCRPGLVDPASSQCLNRGKYSLAIGRQEKFPPKEILNTIFLLPQLKKDFFNKSPFTAYFNYIGIFLIAVIIIITILLFIIIRLAKKN